MNISLTPGKTGPAKPGSKDSAAGKGPAQSIAPPSADEQKKLAREIDEVYKPAEAEDQAAKAALAQKLLEDGQKNEANRAEQFVLLRRAGEIARDAGEPELMLESVDAMATAGFSIRPAQVKAKLLVRLVEQMAASDAARLATCIASCEALAEEASAHGAVEEASDVLTAAHSALAESKKRVQATLRTARVTAARTHSSTDKSAWEKKAADAQEELEAVESAQAAVSGCSKGLQDARRDHEEFQTAQERLKAAPDDAEACLTVGRWYCFAQDDWNEGLTFLAKGSDAGLKSLAADELASKPSKPEEQVARGDAWWEAAEKATGRTKLALRRRAAHWYQEAAPDMAPGLSKARIEKRLADAAEGPQSKATAAATKRVRPHLAIAPFDEKAAQQHQARWAKYRHVPVVQTNSIGMNLTLIPPGEFDMGSTQELIDAELKRHSDNYWYTVFLPQEGPRHHVRITKPFWMGVTTVTQEEYERVMGTNPSTHKGDSRLPVEQVLWDDAVAFCAKLSELPAERAAKRQYVLPTEAQWEYACRAGNEGRCSFSPPTGEDQEQLLIEYAWFSVNATHPVGEKKPNAWGLYDMYGNVQQWCADWHAAKYYAASPTDDPAGPSSGADRALRGSGAIAAALSNRSALRHSLKPDALDAWTGFRIAAVMPDQPGPAHAKTSR
jgi:formylglycine-generating enzyme required for sulfatase activity